MTANSPRTQITSKVESRRKSKRPRKLPTDSSPIPSENDSSPTSETSRTVELSPKEAVLQALGLNAVHKEIITSNTDNLTIKKEAKETLQCNECHEYFKTQTSLKKHCAVDHSIPLIYYCKICTVLFKTRSELTLHREVSHNGLKPYTCTLCPLKFGSLDALTAHVRRHNGKLPYKCNICNHGFDLIREFKAHQSVHELKRANPSTKSNVKHHLCKFCERSFRKPCDLQRHIRVHTGEKPYACSVCGNRFQQAHNLTKHMIIHTKEKQFECDLCKKIFGRSDVLRRHMLTHSILKPQQCGHCIESFSRKEQLLDHVSKKHPEALLKKEARRDKVKDKSELKIKKQKTSPRLSKQRRS